MIRCQKFTLLILNINENVKHDITGSFDDERYKKLRIVLSYQFYTVHGEKVVALKCSTKKLF